MAIKRTDGWTVYSEKGKRLSKPYQTKRQAIRRIKQIEFFKRRPKGSGYFSDRELAQGYKKLH